MLFGINKRGFTLIELMIVIAIVGILAAIAIPNFLVYQAKSKQSEAKMLLKAMHTSEVAYFSENGYFTNDAVALDWRPKTDCRYRYTVGLGFMGNTGSVGTPMNAGSPGADTLNFTALAWSNIDRDDAIDTWQITYTLGLENAYNDVYETDAI